MSWITFDNLKRFWKNVRTNPITFTGEVDLQNTTRYKGNEIATKADVSAGGNNITVDNKLSDTSTNPVQNKIIKEALDGKLSCIDPYTDRGVLSYEDNEIVQTRKSGNASLTIRNKTEEGKYTSYLRFNSDGLHFCTQRELDSDIYFDVTKDNVSICGVPLLTSVTVGKVCPVLYNGHLLFNGNELWIE